MEIFWNFVLFCYMLRTGNYNTTDSTSTTQPPLLKVNYHNCAGIVQTFVYKSSCNQNKEKKRSTEISQV